MRTIHLNLAARPYRDYRLIWIVVAIVSLVTAVLMIANINTAYRYFVNTRETREKIASIEQDTAVELARGKQIEAQLGAVNLRSLALQTSYINAQIAERAFSWSGLLDDLERVMPKDVRLVSLNPAVDKDGTIRITMTLQGKSSRAVIDMINRLQANPHFQRPFPSSQTTDAAITTFGITTEYVPG